MDDRNQIPPQGGDYIPPPPPPSYPVTSDIPPESPYHSSPAPANRNRGLLGGLAALLIGAFAYGKYALLLVFKIPALATLGSALVSIAAYSVWGGP